MNFEFLRKKENTNSRKDVKTENHRELGETF